MSVLLLLLISLQLSTVIGIEVIQILFHKKHPNSSSIQQLHSETRQSQSSPLLLASSFCIKYSVSKIYLLNDISVRLKKGEHC